MSRASSKKGQGTSKLGREYRDCIKSRREDWDRKAYHNATCTYMYNVHVFCSYPMKRVTYTLLVHYDTCTTCMSCDPTSTFYTIPKHIK